MTSIVSYTSTLPPAAMIGQSVTRPAAASRLSAAMTE